MQRRIEARVISEIKIVILRRIVRNIAWLAKFYQHSDLKRLRNKCAMTCGGNMNQNTFNDTDFSLLTKSSFWEIKSDYSW